MSQIREKFKNERRNVKDDPEVLRRKRAAPTSKGEEAVNPKMKGGGINWEPRLPEGEDKTSLNSFPAAPLKIGP